MKCPNCGNNVGEHDAICPACGGELFVDTKLAEKLFSNNSEPMPDDELFGKQNKKPKKKRQGKSFKIDLHSIKLIFIAVLSVAVIVLVAILVFRMMGNKGEKYAKKASDFIGADFEIASKKMDFKIKQESGYKGLTSVVDYDYVAEAEKDVRIDGVNYPEWAILFKLDDNKHITDVRYCNFKGIKSDIKGVKKEHNVNLDKFNPGTEKETIDKELDMKYYSIDFTKDGEAYIYRYWYENDSGDEQPVVLTVNYDENGNFKSYTPQLIYHQFM